MSSSDGHTAYLCKNFKFERGRIDLDPSPLSFSSPCRSLLHFDSYLTSNLPKMDLDNFNQENPQTLIFYILKPGDDNQVSQVVASLPNDGFVVAPTDPAPLNIIQNDVDTTILSQTQSEQLPRSIPPYECLKCGKAFSRVRDLRKHFSWHASVKKFNCDKCSAGFNNENNLQIHKALHQEGRPICPICNVTFQRVASLKSHLLIHQVEELLSCEECLAEFEKEDELIKHLEDHLKPPPEENNLTCSYCKVKFDNYSSYKEHISKHIKMKKIVLGKRTRRSHSRKACVHACQVCSKTFQKVSLLERHMRVHSGERPFVCHHCDRGFSQKGTLQIHLNKHAGIKPFECTLCPAKFSQKGNLRVHVEKTHTVTLPESKIYKCTHCACIFRTVASLNVHITKAHNNESCDTTNVIDSLKELQNDKAKEESNNNTTFVKLAESLSDGTFRRYLVRQKKVNGTRWYMCLECTKSFKKPSDLIRHTRVHTGEKPFVCKRCGASFALKSTLYTHVETHIDVKRFICPVCMKQFLSARTLNSHLRKYSTRKDKMYHCTLCKSFYPTWKEFHLHTHEVHSKIQLKPPLILTPNGFEPALPQDTQKERKHSCNKCKAKFNSIGGLNRHKYTHDRDRRFKCDQCPKTYNALSALKEHKMVHLGIKSHHCKLCDKRYVTTSLLKRHMISHNTEKPYKCPYCDKCFRSLALCKQHIEIHKNDNVEVETNDSTQLDPPLDLTTSVPPEAKEQETQQPVVFVNYDDCLQLNENILFNTLELQDSNIFNMEQENFNNQIFINPNETITKCKNEELTLFLNLEQDYANIAEIPHLDIVKKAEEDEEVPEEVETFACTECDQSFGSKPSLNKHMNIHGVKTCHSCPHCAKRFKKHSDLIRHIRTHTGEKPFSCNICEKSFSLKSTLQSHLKTHNPVSHKTYNCVVCNSYFTSKSSLKVHMNLHTGLKPHKCSYCDMKFRTAAHKRSHESTHWSKNDKKKSKATTLLETVAMDVAVNGPAEEVQSLDNVLIVQDSLPVAIEHLNEPQVLQQLQSNFMVTDEFLPFLQLSDGNLINIKASEPQKSINEKPRDLECDICHKKYASKDVLRKHRKIHGVNKPFPCSKCDRGYNTLEDLLAHDKIHDGSRPFACDYCSNSFTKKHSLATHLKRIHQMTFQEF